MTTCDAKSQVLSQYSFEVGVFLVNKMNNVIACPAMLDWVSQQRPWEHLWLLILLIE